MDLLKDDDNAKYPMQVLQGLMNYNASLKLNPISTRTVALTNAPVTITTVRTHLYGYNIYNPNAVDIFFKFYNSSAPIFGVTAIAETLQVPALGSIVLNGRDPFLVLSTAMSVFVVTGYLDSDSTAPGLSPLVRLIYFR